MPHPVGNRPKGGRTPRWRSERCSFMLSMWLLVLATALYGCTTPTQAVVNGAPIIWSEVAVLQKLQEAWGPTFNGWDVNGDCDSAEGLDCDADGHITAIKVPWYNIVGSLPSEVGSLTALTLLDFGFNKMTGSIPESIGSLLNLQTLQVAHNQLTGSIPESISGLQNLQQLSLDGNSLTGSIPSVIGALQNLVQLDISGNNLVGTIPSSLSALTALTYLELIWNKLTGSIPASIGNLTNLQLLGLGANQLTGSIPASIGDLTKLQRIWFDQNQLTGFLPTTLMLLTALTELVLHRNQLTGSIPASIGALSNLQRLYLNYNTLEGTIPSSIGRMKNLYVLDFAFNQIHGSIPESIGSLLNLQTLQVAHNQLTGSIPESISGLQNLQQLNFKDNDLTGSIPASIGALLNLNALYLAENNLEGTIPSSIGIMENLYVLQVARNKLTGSIPESISGLQNLQQLVLSGNELTGDIPANLRSLTNLQYLDLSGNLLAGIIPSTLGDLTRLQLLDLSHNPLSGIVPGAIGNLNNLEVLNLAGSLATLRCPGLESFCGNSLTSKQSFQESPYCMQYCTRFCEVCKPGVPKETVSRGFNASLKVANSHRNLHFRYASLLRSDIAYSRDWRMSGHVFSIKDQASCSSCWVFSAVAVVESAIAITYGKQVVGISEQQVLDCIDTQDNNCRGGLPESALKYIASISASSILAGLLPADYYPYKASKGSCNVKSQAFIPTPTGVTMYEEVDFFGWFGIVLAVQNQPVIANVHGSHPSFMQYRYVDADPIYKDERCAEGAVDHSVVIVGFNLSSAPPYWIIRNSAGPRWGQGGYMNMRIDKGNGICNIHSSPVLYPVITFPEPCESPLQPCGAGTCLPDNQTSPQPMRNRCLCPPGFVNATNVDGSTSCAPLDVCNFYSKNPCGVGTCVSYDDGGYFCICPLGYTPGRIASDSTPTCIPATMTSAGNVTYSVPRPGLTCTTVAAAYGLSEIGLLQGNPQLSESDCLDLPSGKILNISVPGLSRGCNVRYSWSKNDTCKSISELTGLKQAEIQSLNMWLNCTPGQLPNPGQQVCLRNSSRGELNGSLPRCNLYKPVNSSDTCGSIIARHFPGKPINFFALNPGLFCDSIGAYSDHPSDLPPIDEVCVDGGMQGSQLCRTYMVRGRDTCSGILTRFFGGSVANMTRINSGWQCKNWDLYNGRVICIPSYGRPPPPHKKSLKATLLTGA